MARQTSLPQSGKVLRERVLGAVDDPQILPAPAFHRRLDKPLGTADDELTRLDHHAFAAPLGSSSHQPMPLSSLAASSRSITLNGVTSRGRDRVGRCGQRFHVPDMILVGVDLSLRLPEGGKGRASGRPVSSQASNIAGMQRRIAQSLHSGSRDGEADRRFRLSGLLRRLARQSFGRLSQVHATTFGNEARPAAPTAAYWDRRSSWALADQGINSQSRQAQSVLNCVQKPLESIAARIRARKSVSSCGSLKNRRPVRV